jgi:hypothetical protein
MERSSIQHTRSLMHRRTCYTDHHGDALCDKAWPCVVISCRYSCKVFGGVLHEESGVQNYTHHASFLDIRRLHCCFAGSFDRLIVRSLGRSPPFYYCRMLLWTTTRCGLAVPGKLLETLTYLEKDWMKDAHIGIL